MMLSRVIKATQAEENRALHALREVGWDFERAVNRLSTAFSSSPQLAGDPSAAQPPMTEPTIGAKAESQSPRGALEIIAQEAPLYSGSADMLAKRIIRICEERKVQDYEAWDAARVQDAIKVLCTYDQT